VIDYWKLTRDFAQDDSVQKINVIDGSLSPYMGRVTAVHRGIGCLDVQWPFGNERVFPDDVVRVNPQFVRYLPPAFDQSYMSWDIAKARKASTSSWKTDLFPATAYVRLAQFWHKGAGEVEAYDNLYRQLAPNVDDETLRAEVETFYRFARNAADLRVHQEVVKSGAYWVAQNRTYRATADEIKSGRPNCPKCASRMRRATYRMHEGSRVKLFACTQCVYLLDPTSVVGPTGEPHTW
jgi:hypothetical protein